MEALKSEYENQKQTLGQREVKVAHGEELLAQQNDAFDKFKTAQEALDEQTKKRFDEREEALTQQKKDFEELKTSQQDLDEQCH